MGCAPAVEFSPLSVCPFLSVCLFFSCYLDNRYPQIAYPYPDDTLLLLEICCKNSEGDFKTQ